MHTKKDYEDLMLKILNPLKPFYSEGKAYLNIGNTSAIYTDKIAQVEGFARPLWALAPYYAEPTQKEQTFADIYREGFKNGTNPFHREYWGEVDDYSQVLVEMAAMGFALILAPDTFFAPLSEQEKKNLAQWLYTINDHKYYDNNWVMFQLLVNIGLRNVGMTYNEENIEWAIAKIEQWYKGDGWYTDGKDKQCDYYVAFAIHFYSLIYAKYIEKAYPDRSNRIKERAKLFAKDYIYWFDNSGAAVPYGRSLTYRFAQSAFWSALVWADASPFPLGVVKGIINRNLTDWLGAPIFDNAGILTIGYKYPNLFMSETYNAPGSPYWAMKAFLILALPAEHEFFSVEAQQLPELESVHEIAAANMIVTNNGTNAVIYPKGLPDGEQFHQMPEKYGKFAYSSRFGFSVSRSQRLLGDCAPDSMLCFVTDDFVYTNRCTKSAELMGDKRIRLFWTPCNGIEVETIITPYENAHKREHTIRASFSCTAYDAGYAVMFDEKTKLSNKSGEALAVSDKGGCRIYSEYGEGVIIDAAPNTNLIYTHTKIPALRYEIPVGESKIVSMVYEIEKENE